MLFAPGRSKDLGMPYEDARAHSQQLNGIHPWVGSAVEVTTLLRMVKEGRYDVARAKQYTHERAKERLAKKRASPAPSPTGSPQPRHSLPKAARGCGMTWRADRYFIQETLRNMNLCWDYYDRFTQITVLLPERHLNHFHPGELARMSKDCFYTGLRAKHRPMVVHLKDHPNFTPLDLLAALMENEQNDTLANAHYPPATSSKMTAGGCHTDHPRAPRHMDKQDWYADQKPGGYAVHQMQLGRDELARDCGDAVEDGYVVCPVQLRA